MGDIVCCAFRDKPENSNAVPCSMVETSEKRDVDWERKTDDAHQNLDPLVKSSITAPFSISPARPQNPRHLKKSKKYFT
ncbi:unnamed protein product [Moneuplotes crassus]|uniref:Uncharacterized protein n=1 Tax=Euplotes crassus TaxID=5936 RepID=A0AAD1UQ98_EUPCR|nr:unnamed protein product [Moneuplotes crassus]